MVNDPISDFIIQLKNASIAKKGSVTVPFSKLKLAVAEILIKNGFLVSAERHGKKIRNKSLEVTLKYDASGVSEIAGVKRMSKLGKRVYIKSKEIRPVKFGQGIMILSTPKGLKTDREARNEKVGGEALFSIW